jgi:acyl-homoserine-lactone acylase
MHCYLMSMAPFDLPDAYRRPPASFTGNAWAIAPEQTRDGKPLLVINPHGYHDGPFQWYEAQLTCHAMGLNVSGATLFGLPVILQGHNDVLGWALTPNQPDFADMYVEPGPQPQANPKVIGGRKIGEEQLLYMALMAQSRPYYVLTQDGVVERGVPCASTARGPVMGRYRGRLCSYQVGGYHDFGALVQCVEMGRAQTLADFQAALAMHQLPCFHVVYADRDGNIFYLYNVKVGDKATFQRTTPPGEEKTLLTTPIDWTSPRWVENPVYAWGDIVPVESLPTTLNPESGFIQACGNPPWTATMDSGISPDHWPPWFAGDRDTYRAKRVRQLLAMGPRSFVDCQSMLYDVLIPFAADAVPRLLETADAQADFVANAHPDLAAGLTLLREWNFVGDVGAPAMTFFHEWWTALHVLDPEAFANDDTLFAALWENSPAIQNLSLQAAAQAARNLRNEYDAPAVPWGEVHVVRRGDVVRPISGATTGEPIFIASDTVYDNGVWPVTYGYAFAMVVEFGNRPRAVSMVPFGSSEDPRSPHFADQLELMLARRFKVTRFQEEDVQRYARSARGRMVRLRPEGMPAVFDLAAPYPIEARLYVSTEPPAPLPDGLATFSMYAGPEYVPRDVPVELNLDVVVPDTVCAPENVSALDIYSYDRQEGWQPLVTEQGDDETHRLIAHDSQARVYAVLGPAAFRLSTAPSTEDTPAFPQAPSDAPASVTVPYEDRPRKTSLQATLPAEHESPQTPESEPVTAVSPDAAPSSTVSSEDRPRHDTMDASTSTGSRQLILRGSGKVQPPGQPLDAEPRPAIPRVQGPGTEKAEEPVPGVAREPRELMLRGTQDTSPPPAGMPPGPAPPLMPRDSGPGSAARKPCARRFVPGVGFVDSPPRQDVPAARRARESRRTSTQSTETPSGSKNVRRNFTHR